ncbi:MAG: MerR family transcriptional regulator [Deltaproteobacteria bacterium]|nr:MerR family transcriptional regulator [Deltaproteobacteria bacterium]
MNRGSAIKQRRRARLRIGDVASRAGVNPQTLRYYERRGILGSPKRSPAGYREYPIDTVRLIRFIKRAQELGFTLTEIEELITLRQATSRQRSKVRELAAAKMRDIDEKLARLQAMRSALSTLVEGCACGAQAVTCPILEALDDVSDAEAADGTR